MHIPIRRAFTLVEVLVVIGIIGILVSLLLPAVQMAREAARRMSCQNNIRQLALAIKNYESTYKVYPASGIVDTSTPDFRGRSGKMFSWIVLILPRIEQESLYAEFDFNVSVLQQSREPQTTHVSALHCPSDGNSGDYYAHATYTNGKSFAKGNYAAYCSPMHTDLQTRFPGALISHTARTSASFQVDGESNTIMLSEVRAYSHTRDQRGAWALPWTGASLLAFDMHHIAPVVWGERGFRHNPASLGVTQPPNNQGPNLDMLYDCPDPAGAQIAKMPCNIYTGSATGWLSAAPRSNHPGGVNTALVDGSVHFMINEFDQITMAYMISVGEREVVFPP
jgi:prepilin-type N-terminal cleavage/methylation domain-containing protein/prepilin-type processing-associated H-X9-DG protein